MGGHTAPPNNFGDSDLVSRHGQDKIHSLWKNCDFDAGVEGVAHAHARCTRLAERRTIAHIRRACAVISTRTFLASAGLLTSRRNAMRAPRVPSWVFKRT